MTSAGEPITCRRPGCSHLYAGEHAPGGGNCMVWNPATGERCGCPGFRYVELAEARPVRHSGQPR